MFFVCFFLWTKWQLHVPLSAKEEAGGGNLATPKNHEVARPKVKAGTSAASPTPTLRPAVDYTAAQATLPQPTSPARIVERNQAAIGRRPSQQ